MSRNASGTYTLPAGQPVVTGTVVSSSTFNTLTSDLATEMSDSLSRSGKGGMSSALVLNAGAAVGAPDLSWTGDTDTGIYRIGANNFGLAANGAKVVDIGAAGIAVTGTLSASGVTSFADGAVGTPGLNFTGDTNTGIYRIGADDLGFSCGGVKQLELTTAAATIVQNTTVSGTLTSTGAFVGSSTANIVGNFSVATNKFTVAAASGNTVVAGTLNVTGASTLTGLITAPGGITVSTTGAGTAGTFAATVGNSTGIVVSGAGTSPGISITAGGNVNASSSGAIRLQSQSNLVAGAGAGCTAGEVCWNGTNFLACKTNGTWTLLL